MPEKQTSVIPVAALVQVDAPASAPVPVPAPAHSQVKPVSKSKNILIILCILSLVSAMILTIVTSLQLNKYIDTLNEKAKIENINKELYKGINYLAYFEIALVGLLLLLLLLAYILKITYKKTYKNNKNVIGGCIFVIFSITIIISCINIRNRRQMKYGYGYVFMNDYVKHLKDIDDKLVEIFEYITLGLLILTYIVAIYFYYKHKVF
jgi:hypothetical protein